MADEGWHYQAGGAEHGPVSPALLKRLADLGKLLPEDRVRRQGESRWVAARSVKGLFEENGPQIALPTTVRGADPAGFPAAGRLSDWGLASLVIGCTMLLSRSNLGPGFVLFDNRKSVTTILLLSVSELIHLTGVAFSLWAGIYGVSAARKTNAGRGLPMAGIVVSGVALLSWLIGLIALIRALDSDRW